MAAKVKSQKNPVGRPDEALRTVIRLRKTPGQYQPVGTFKLPTALRRIQRLQSLGVKDIRITGDAESILLEARVRVGQKVVQPAKEAASA